MYVLTGDDDNTRMTTEENGVVIIIGVTVGILLVLIPLVVACVWFGTKKYDQLQEERYFTHWRFSHDATVIAETFCASVCVPDCKFGRAQRSMGRGGNQLQTAAQPRGGSQRSRLQRW